MEDPPNNTPLFKEYHQQKTYPVGSTVVVEWATMRTRLLFRQKRVKKGSKSRASRLVS